MKISIITATYNSQATLKSTFESILSQQNAEYELIVVDGASMDGTIDLIKEYEPKFGGRMRWISEPDNGIYDAMNKGIALASGDIIGFLNSDDVYADNSILELVSKNIQGVDAVYGDLKFVDSNNNLVREWHGSQYPPNGFRGGWHPAHPTFYAKRECYEDFGCFDTAFDVSADFEIMLRFIEKHQIKTKYIPHTLVNMRMGGESTGSLKKILQGNMNIRRAFKKNQIPVSPLYPILRLAPKFIDLIKHKVFRPSSKTN